MRGWLLTGLLLAISANALAVPQVITVSRQQYGQAWPFTREEVMLQCRSGHALYVINDATLAQYPLNEVAQSQVNSHQVQALSLTSILLDDPQHQGKKMDVTLFISKAETLC